MRTKVSWQAEIYSAGQGIRDPTVGFRLLVSSLLQIFYYLINKFS